MKSFLKNLKDLAGGVDNIFVIIDDRFDVWMEEYKDKNEVVRKRVSQNLLLISPYVYHDFSNE